MAQSKTNVRVVQLVDAGSQSCEGYHVYTPFNDALRVVMREQYALMWEPQGKYWKTAEAPRTARQTLGFQSLQADIASGGLGATLGGLGFTLTMDRRASAGNVAVATPVPPQIAPLLAHTAIPGAGGHMAAEAAYGTTKIAARARNMGKTAATETLFQSQPTPSPEIGKILKTMRDTNASLSAPVRDPNAPDMKSLLDHLRMEMREAPNGPAMSRLVPVMVAAPDGSGKSAVLFKCSENDFIKLFHHQFEIVAKFRSAYHGRMIVAHEPGMGKTLTAIVTAAIHCPRDQRIVVACPEHLRVMWRDQFKRVGRFAFAYGIDDLAGRNWSATSDGVLVIGYSSCIKSTMAKLNREAGLEFGFLIVDEGHHCGNHEAQRTMRITEWGALVPHVMFLTGTPMPSRIAQLFPMLSVCRPLVYKNFFAFADRYCNARKTKFGWDFTGHSNLEELSSAVATIMHRMRKQDALDLPPKVRHLVSLALTAEERATLDKQTASLWDGVTDPQTQTAARKQADTRALGALSKLRGLTWAAKQRAVFQWIDDFLESGQKLVIFTHHKSTAEDILAHVRKRTDIGSSVVTGDVPDASRQTTFKSFQENENFKVLIGTMGSMGTGVTLTAASHLAFVEYDWVPSTMRQAEDRIHRIGQNEGCTIYYLTADGTIEASMIRTLSKKIELADQVIDGGRPVTNEDIAATDFNPVAELSKVVPMPSNHDGPRFLTMASVGSPLREPSFAGDLLKYWMSP